MGNVFCCNGKSDNNSDDDEDDVPFTAHNGNSQHDITENLIVTRQQDVNDVYEIVSLIGRGSISNIYKIRRRRRKRSNDNNDNGNSDEADQAANNHQENDDQEIYYALKEINLQVVNPEYMNEMRNEIELLRTLDHPNIIRAFETYYYDSYQHGIHKQMIGIVLELCSGGDLSSRLPYTERQAGTILYQLTQAIHYLHSRSIIHRDVKFQNIMFESNQPQAEIKLIDFGLSKKFLQQHELVRGLVGTVYTMSPQVLQGYYTSQCDMWSVGVVAFELLSGEKPFWGNSMGEIAARVLKGDYSFESPVWTAVSTGARHFCTRLLQYAPTLRYTAQAALNDAWLSQFRTAPTTVLEPATMQQVWTSLASFSNKSELERLAWLVMARKATTEEIFQLRQVFEQVVQEQQQQLHSNNNIGGSNSGQISFSDFRNIMSRVVFRNDNHDDKNDKNNVEMENIFRHVDVNQTGCINYTEFLAATLAVQGRIQEQRIAEAFDQLDVDGSGFITREDLRHILGKQATPQYIDQIMSELHVDPTNGKVGYAAFQQVLRQTHSKHVKRMETLLGGTKAKDVSAS